MTKKNTKTNKLNKKPGNVHETSAAGRAYVTATFNNTLVTITDTNGRTICWGSAGASGFKGARKSTPYAATTAVEQVARKAKEKGIESVEVYIKGAGPGRDGAIRALKAVGLDIAMIADVTPIPHNGPRASKKRRV
ncbi:30S ribosomal protein S11 [Candidatus Curtissbacteria bacterium RIFCSPHIGHO2_01_FULL_41_44]|uniref:Small ribosomal subunit protein uS11 n=1 Tax=Candidatus Curtissbacteria bacterium RIFCSPLOWO2_01_FULL_42_50 TaxID=1797730 RepID=A0A1F5H2M5_9BACT|nr:MAG: 30S ribosomal protein S11 [Candidatus Curtissbacteria bacterium RIFCSPHIGHO2_02_FULL_42_58]OGD94752.1 MAG: 30S ribosomal protein S11 [Candidatus Curtissbacteria bacterium RIFCSPHIGHO2_01_FULL_41_44]OGD96295.1 MAG: 30S ribosomal protein S11 [Candidatus Curtissbacteria bacterium RIFCSPHIGHO2_12_FULL_42_33]OGD98314.1 MAG: 30S ribosomal protein S11 [Candidatus Curtissbacteria bacterium RIFCSPLOWO2_01_FULL_42_50]OGE02951.1 MAG: 30S ribosomal protein S11 [Candidatus Curtissbacteria bacterium 